MNIVIYGTGKYGKKMLSILEKMNISSSNDISFCQTERKSVSMGNYPVFEPEELTDFGEIIVLIAIADREIQRSIMENLRKIGIKNVYKMAEFIEQWEKNNKRVSGEFCCNICEHSNVAMSPGGISEGIFLEHRIIGGGYRENVICSACGASDRMRWAKWVIENRTNILKQVSTKVLHFAPEKGISDIINENVFCDYYTADIEMGRAEHVIDITDIPFRDEMFDYIIANHVLEHIPDEKKAMEELMRVLKPEGTLLLSYPICMDMPTFEDCGLVTKGQRLKYYGQEDHVRLYGNDYKEHMEAFRLKVDVMSPRDFFDEKEIEKMAMDKEDIIMLCKKI